MKVDPSLLVPGRESSDLLPSDPDAWLAWRVQPAPPGISPPKRPILEQLDWQGSLESQLSVAPSRQVAEAALAVAYQEELRSAWGVVAKCLMRVELQPMDAILVLHSMVKMDLCDRRLLMKVVDRIECRYFSMDVGLKSLALDPTLDAGEIEDNHPATELFPGTESFRSLVDSLPMDHKIKIILMDNFSRETGAVRTRAPPPDPDAKAKWKTADPVEMELWERKQFEQGRIKIKRMRDVSARVSRMQPGNKLSASLSLQLLHVLPGASLSTLAEIVQVSAFFPRVRPLRGDLMDDFREAIAKRLTQREVDTHLLRPYLLAFASGLRDCPGPEAYRAWRRKLLPAVVQLCRRSFNEVGLEVFDLQWGFHSRLRGVPHTRDSPAVSESEESPDVEAQDEAPAGESDPGSGAAGNSLSVEASCRHAERASALFIAVTTARQVSIDAELFDLLARPVKTAIKAHLSEKSSHTLLPVETLADLLDACVSCGIDDVENELPKLILDLFHLQFGDDTQERGQMSMKDLCTMAHAASVLCRDGVEAPLARFWALAEPRLRSTEPHLVLMMLNALVRAGSEELLTSPALVAAVDEHLVQRLDLDRSRLGRLGL